MRIDILTLFPEMFESFLTTSILGRAVEKGLVSIKVHNIRDFADNKHKQADDYPYGGGAGMVLMPQPLSDCIKHVLSQYREKTYEKKQKLFTFLRKARCSANKWQESCLKSLL